MEESHKVRHRVIDGTTSGYIEVLWLLSKYITRFILNNCRFASRRAICPLNTNNGVLTFTVCVTHGKNIFECHHHRRRRHRRHRRQQIQRREERLQTTAANLNDASDANKKSE